ncbi:MAG: PA domain-containing protein [Bryobacteraceae bacterium]
MSSAAFQGRGTGTPAGDAAASYIADHFKKAGLQPLGGASFFQPFPVSIESKLGTINSFSYTLAGETVACALADEFTPLNFSGSGSLEGEVVYAGYGITAAEYGYDDYAGIDVRGKIVLILRHEPQEFDNSSRFEGRIYTEHAQLFSKALNARMHGARAILYSNDSANHSGEELEKFVSLVGPADPGIPFVQVKSSVAEKWFAQAGKDFKASQEAIDKQLQPQSFPFGSGLHIHLSVDVVHRSKEVFNVVGYLPGSSREYIVVGAHYDHLGLGEQYSLSPEKAGQTHPGADDTHWGPLECWPWHGNWQVSPSYGRVSCLLLLPGKKSVYWDPRIT